MSLVYFVLVVTVLASVAANPFKNMNGMRQTSRVKRQVAVEELQDPDDPEYMKLAEEAYNRYHESHLDGYLLKNIMVIKVTRQVVQGFTYRLRFIAYVWNPYGSRDMVCNSKVWEKVNYKKEFKTHCSFIDNKQQKRVTRRKLGDEKEKDPNDPEYQELAKESLAKYIKAHNDDGIIPKEIIVRRATYQVVSGSLKHIQFVVSTNLPYSLACDSKVWEQPWLNKKDIDIDCIPSYDQ